MGSATGVNADGTIVVGRGGSRPGLANQISFIWTEADALRNLEDVLTTDYGLDLTGWTLGRATGTGTTIVGTGINPLGQTEAWMATLTPVPLPGAFWLFGSGLVGLFAYARRSRKSKKSD